MRACSDDADRGPLLMEPKKCVIKQLCFFTASTSIDSPASFSCPLPGPEQHSASWLCAFPSVVCVPKNCLLSLVRFIQPITRSARVFFSQTFLLLLLFSCSFFSDLSCPVSEHLGSTFGIFHPPKHRQSLVPQFSS